MDQQSVELGFSGILKTTARIFRTNLKHFLCISAVLFLGLAVDLVIAPLPPNKEKAMSIAWSNQSSSPFNSTALPGSQLHVPVVFVLVTITLSLFNTFVILPALSIGICIGFLNKTLHLKASLRVIPKACVGILITYLCLIAAVTVAVILLLLLIIVPFFILPLLKIDPVRPVLMLLLTGFASTVYLFLVWSLAFTVTILEEERGWGALRRSAYLINGRKEVAVGLFVLFLLCSSLIPTPTSGKETSASSRFAIAVLAAALSTLISLFSTGTTVVLYLSCKLHHNESVEGLSAVTHYSCEELTLSKYTNLDSLGHTHLSDMANV